MAQNITLLGASYTDVPAVELPKTGGGTASFTDVTPTTAVATDVLQGKYFFTASGVLTLGTATGGGSVTQDQDGFIVLPSDGGGGGGGSNWELLASQEFTVSTTSSTETTVGQITLDLSKYKDPEIMLWVHIRDKAGKRAGYWYGNDTIFFHYQLANGSTNTLSTNASFILYVNSSEKYVGASTAFGVYAERLYYTSTNHYVRINSKYGATYGTVDGTYKCDVYTLKPPTGMTLFEVEEENE